MTLKVGSNIQRQANQHRRDDERQQHRGAHDALEAEVAVEQQREPHAERELEDRGPERIEHRVLERLLEDGVVDRLREIGEADELALVATRMLVSENHSAITNG